MLWFFTPYSFERRLFEAWDNYMNLVKDPDDWVCMMDGDTMFLTPAFGHKIQRYINKFPDTGTFTCYASRCHYQVQIRQGTETENTDMMYHRTWAESIERELDGRVKEIDGKIAGHLMVMKRSTWTRIRPMVLQETKIKTILGVDTKISRAVLSSGMKIRLMRGIYILHYLRLKEGYDYKNHLQ